MNITMENFNYPQALIREYSKWVVLIRPEQLTLGSVVIASKSDTISFGDLTREEIEEFPKIVSDFEQTLRLNFGATKFNYLGLMMVDPNPHFHGIPRYSAPVTFEGEMTQDHTYPEQVLLSSPLQLDNNYIKRVQKCMIENWQT